MSDINISGIPNLGIPGMGGGAILGGNAMTGQPALGAAGDFGASKFSQPLYNNIFNNFGQQTDYYSALGAAYGRGTGYYGDTSGLPPGQAPQPGGGGVAPPQQVPIDSSVFDTGAQPVPYPNTSNVWGATPGGGIGSTGFGNDYYASVLAQLQGANSGQYPTSPAPPSLPNFSDLWAQRAGGQFPVPTNPTSIGLPPTPPEQRAVDWDKYFQETTGPQRGSGSNWEAAYLTANPDVAAAGRAAGRDPTTYAEEHYKNFGQAEGRKFFDPIQYLQQNQDVAASGMDALQHYNNFGRGEGRNQPMGSVFDPATYLMNNRDVADAGVDPRTHWLQYGQKEGRRGGGIVADMPQAPGPMPDMQRLLGYDPNKSASFAPQQNPSPFFGAFSQFPNSATPSQYTASPYTNAQGQTFQPNLPPGFAPQFDVDHPQGALPRNWNNQAGGA